MFEQTQSVKLFESVGLLRFQNYFHRYFLNAKDKSGKVNKHVLMAQTQIELLIRFGIEQILVRKKSRNIINLLICRGHSKKTEKLLE